MAGANEVPRVPGDGICNCVTACGGSPTATSGAARRAKKRTRRPRIAIDWRAFDSLCKLQCTQVEIASFFGVSVDTIERALKREHGVRFADYFAETGRSR